MAERTWVECDSVSRYQECEAEVLYMAVDQKEDIIFKGSSY